MYMYWMGALLCRFNNEYDSTIDIGYVVLDLDVLVMRGPPITMAALLRRKRRINSAFSSRSRRSNPGRPAKFSCSPLSSTSNSERSCVWL